MKVKIIAVLAIVSALFIGAVLWRTDSFVYGDRLSWVEAQTRTQLGAINYSLVTELKSLQRVIATFNAENFQKGKLNWLALKPYYGAASFSLNSAGGEVQLEPQILLTKENTKAANWTKDFVKSALGGIAGSTSDLKFFIKPFQDSQKGRYVALVFLEGRRAYALFGSGEIFQSLIDAQRGALSSFSIVTETGLTVGHSVPEYLGTLMRDDPVFKEAQQGGSSHGSNTFKLKSGDLYGMYERIPYSNLIVLSSAPLSDTMKGRSGLWWQFFLLGCGLVAVGIAAVLVVISPSEKQIELLEKQLQVARARPSVPVLTEKVIAQDPEAVHKEKLQASMRVASALSHEMSGPLASILGYSQMILAKSPEPDIVQSTESIVRETRAARGVLDKLLVYAGEEVKEKNTMKVEGPLVKALKGLEPLFAKKGVKLTKNFQDTTTMDLNVDAIIRALTNILQNSVEAMERMANKEITIDLFEDADGIHLSIEDKGEGIEPQNVDKIFDPFFTTRSFLNHMGLGLSVAFGILKEHNAEVQVESQRGRGTKIMILFRKQQTVSVLKAPSAEAPVSKDEIVMAKALPRLKEESLHREEAEAQFAKQQEAEQPIATKPQSPLDINIENLLDLPEAGEQRMEFAEKGENAESKSDLIDLTGSGKKTSLSAANGSAPVNMSDEDLAFIDGFLEEDMKSNDKAGTEALVSLTDKSFNEMGPNIADLETVDKDLAFANLVAPPKMPAKKKASKLDSYHVEIRRPGKRI